MEADPAVLAKVRDRLDTAAGVIHPADSFRSEDRKSVVTTRRHIDVPVGSERRRRYEPDRLSLDPLRESIVDDFEEFSHGFNLCLGPDRALDRRLSRHAGVCGSTRREIRICPV